MNEMKDALYTVVESSSQDSFSMALLALLKQKPYSQITISELCEQANLSRKTFYKYFTGLDELIDHVYEGFVLAYQRYPVPANGKSECYNSFLHFFSFWYYFRDWVGVLVKNDLWDEDRLMTEQQHSLLAPRDWSGTPADGEHNRYLLYAFLGVGCVRMIKNWYQEGFKQTPEELAELVDFALSGNMIATPIVQRQLKRKETFCGGHMGRHCPYTTEKRSIFAGMRC